jgi:hypothetical protein
MSRTAILKTTIISAAVIIAGAGGAAWTHVANSPSHKVTITTNSQHRLTQLSYRGEQGRDALQLLKEHARVQTKHYSFGDMVLAINGVQGNGPKYWTFYINGHEATVGAGAYQSKNTDTLSWKLQ